MNEKIKEQIIDIIVDAISGLIIGIALYNFAADAKFPLTGLSGIAMIFYQFWGWKIGVTTLILNIPLILYCFKVLGKKFMFKSFKTMIIGTIMMDFVTPLIPVIRVDDVWAQILIVGVLTGIGYAIIYMRGTSSGGADFVIMAIKARRPHVSLGKIFFLVDVAVIVIDTIAYAPSIQSMIYGLVISFIASNAVDRFMITADAGMMCMIVTNNAQKIADKIDEAVDRGCTIFTAKGGYTGEDRQVLMCACSNKQMYQVNREAKKIDQDAFIVIMESKEVYGEGFKRFKG